MADKHTTLRLKEALIRQAKLYAREHDMTLTAVMERALTEYLAGSRGRAKQAAGIRLPAFGRGGPRSGVDLDDTSALLDLMDGTE